MPDDTKPYRDWNRKQWAPDEEKQERTANPDEPAQKKHWDKTEWVGERPNHTRIPSEGPEQMEEGESALSGMRHNPGEQHWANTERGKGEAGKKSNRNK